MCTAIFAFLRSFTTISWNCWYLSFLSSVLRARSMAAEGWRVSRTRLIQTQCSCRWRFRPHSFVNKVRSKQHVQHLNRSSSKQRSEVRVDCRSSKNRAAAARLTDLKVQTAEHRREVLSKLDVAGIVFMQVEILPPSSGRQTCSSLVIATRLL